MCRLDNQNPTVARWEHQLWVVTNGFGPKAKALRQVLPDGVLLRDTLKTGPEHSYFTQMDVTNDGEEPGVPVL